MLQPLAEWLMRISIHALREEGDCSVFRDLSTITISIHALREEGDATANPMI